ncbi:MAG: hypothetical protein GY769_13595, partial [bacterium]|nr:hypothetical protein [bacterium]
EPADSLADSASKRARVRPAPGQEADDAAAAEAASTESALPWRGRAALMKELATLDEDDKVDSDTILKVCSATNTAIEADKWSSQDTMSPYTVKFWFRQYVHHVEDLKDTFVGDDVGVFVEGLPLEIRQYPAFVLTRLLRATWADLRKMASCMGDLVKIAPALLPPIGHALVEAAVADISAAECYAYNDLPLQLKNKFFLSPLYKDFLAERSRTFIAQARTSESLSAG